jgi:hypothetical protein
MAPSNICVFGIDNAIGDAALEASPCCAAMVHEGVVEAIETAGLVPEADPDVDEPDGIVEDSVELGIFVSVARVMVLVTPCEATTTTEVPI